MEKRIQETKTYAQITKSNLTAGTSVKMINNVKQIIDYDKIEGNKKENNLTVKRVADIKRTISFSKVQTWPLRGGW